MNEIKKQIKQNIDKVAQFLLDYQKYYDSKGVSAKDSDPPPPPPPPPIRWG